MTRIIRFEVPGAPAGKGRARFVRATGHAYTPARTGKYEGLVRLAAAQAMAGSAPIAGACAVAIRALVPAPQSWSRKKRAAALAGNLYPTTRPDVDNYAKIILDACNGVVFIDDKQVVLLRVSKAYSDRPRLEAEIAVLEKPE